MKFKTFILDNSKECIEANFLSKETELFLKNSHDKIYSFFKNANDKSEHFVSLAASINKCIINDLNNQSILNNGTYNLIKSGRNHVSAIYDIIVDDIFYKASEKNENFIIFLNSNYFKEEYNFDSSTITFDYFTEKFNEFIDKIKPKNIVKIHIVLLLELEREVEVYFIGKNKKITIL